MYHPKINLILLINHMHMVLKRQSELSNNKHHQLHQVVLQQFQLAQAVFRLSIQIKQAHKRRLPTHKFRLHQLQLSHRQIKFLLLLLRPNRIQIINLQQVKRHKTSHFRLDHPILTLLHLKDILHKVIKEC